MTTITNITDLCNHIDKGEEWFINTINQAITDIRQYQDRMSIDGRHIQHIADSLERLVK